MLILCMNLLATASSVVTVMSTSDQSKDHHIRRDHAPCDTPAGIVAGMHLMRKQEPMTAARCGKKL